MGPAFDIYALQCSAELSLLFPSSSRADAFSKTQPLDTAHFQPRRSSSVGNFRVSRSKAQAAETSAGDGRGTTERRNHHAESLPRCLQSWLARERASIVTGGAPTEGETFQCIGRELVGGTRNGTAGSRESQQLHFLPYLLLVCPPPLFLSAPNRKQDWERQAISTPFP